MAELTEEAKAEIREAIRIVREDKFEHFVRDKLKPEEKEETPTRDQGRDPKAKAEPPPPKVVTEEAAPKKAGLWWGDRLETTEEKKEAAK